MEVKEKEMMEESVRLKGRLQQKEEFDGGMKFKVKNEEGLENKGGKRFLHVEQGDRRGVEGECFSLLNKYGKGWVDKLWKRGSELSEKGRYKKDIKDFVEVMEEERWKDWAMEQKGKEKFMNYLDLKVGKKGGGGILV